MGGPVLWVGKIFSLLPNVAWACMHEATHECNAHAHRLPLINLG